MSKSQVERNKKYLANNDEAKAKQRLHIVRSTAKNFVLKKATLEDVKNFREFLDEREKMLLDEC